LPLHISVHIYDHLQGAREQYFVQLLNWILLMYVRCVFVQYVAVITVGLYVCPELLSGWDLVIESNLVTAQSTAHEPPENGRKYGPKHVGASSLKCF